jgi:hypothetical protein
MAMSVTRDDARRLVDQLPEEFQWDDLMRLIYERISIERGIEDVRSGRVTPVEELRKSYGLPS